MTEREAFAVVVQTLMACTAEDIAAGVRGISERTAHLQRRALDLYSRAVQERDEARAMLAELERAKDAPINQCDGCRTGAPVVDGLHKDASGRSFMACEAYRYGVRDAGPTPFAGRTTRRKG